MIKRMIMIKTQGNGGYVETATSFKSARLPS